MPQNEALWYAGAGRVEIRAAETRAPAAGEARVSARYSGISRGTERLVFQGRVPVSEHERMRCPHQEGAFSFPVKYGYALTGVITDGPKERIGENVFLLHPHQRETCVALADLRPLPAGLPLRRAALAANMETALNVIWDAGIAPGQRILVIGAGVLGLLIAGQLGQMAAKIMVTDINPQRAAIAAQLGAEFVPPDNAPTQQDIVIHTSGTEAGLKLALASAAFEARIVEASWYGDKDVAVPLGGAFHSQRLSLISSQVGSVAPSRRAFTTYAQRMAQALDLLRDDRFDALITGEIAFADAPAGLPKVLADGSDGLMTVLRYT